MTEPIWPGYTGEDAEGPFIRGGRCAACGGRALEPRPVCPHCLSDAGMAELPVGRRGVLYTATVVHQAPPGFAVPFRVGYVDVEDGIRVFAHIADGPGRPEIGDTVALSIRTLKTAADGTALVGPFYAAPRPEAA